MTRVIASMEPVYDVPGFAGHRGEAVEVVVRDGDDDQTFLVGKDPETLMYRIVSCDAPTDGEQVGPLIDTDSDAEAIATLLREPCAECDTTGVVERHPAFGGHVNADCERCEGTGRAA